MGEMNDAKRLALTYLSHVECDHLGVIEDENVLAAALLYSIMSNEGLVSIERSESGPVIRIAPAGRARLTEQEGRS